MTMLNSEYSSYDNDSLIKPDSISPRPRFTTIVMLATGVIFCLGVVLICPVDEVVTGTGVLTPATHSFSLSAEYGGRLRRLFVKNGSEVRKGDILAVFDVEALRLQVSELVREASICHSISLAEEIVATRMQDYPTWKSKDRLSYLSGGEISSHEWNAVISEAKEELSNERVLEDKIASAQASLRKTTEEAKELESQMTVMRSILGRKTSLAMEGLVSRVSVEELELRYLSLLKDHSSALRSTDELAVEVDSARDDLAHQRDSFLKYLRRDAVEQARQEASIRAQIHELEDKLGQENMVAPFAGSIQQLSVSQAGGYLNPGEKLAVIVPVSEALNAEVTVSSRDVAYIHRGQHVKMKIDAYEYGRYGTVSGTVADISADIANSNHDEIFTSSNGPSAASGVIADGYSITIRFPTIEFHSREGLGHLRAGMSLQADISIGSRTIGSYLFAGMRRLVQSSFTKG